MGVEIINKTRGKTVSGRRIAPVASRILEILKHGDYELSIALVGNKEIRKLNAQYRSKDQPTDVLSFPIDRRVPGSERLLGDVIISVEKARQQAKERRRSLDQEVMILLIHGILHLLGYDHERSAKEARTMGRLEKRIFTELCESGVLKV